MKAKIVLGLVIAGMARVYGQVDQPDSSANNHDPAEKYEIIDNPAQFPGGMIELFRYVKENTKYPKSAKRQGIKGKVFVEFIVNKDGSVIKESVKVVRFSDLKIPYLREADIITDAECEQEALRVVKSLPNWIPGTHRNHPVQVKNVLPVKFG